MGRSPITKQCKAAYRAAMSNLSLPVTTWNTGRAGLWGVRRRDGKYQSFFWYRNAQHAGPMFGTEIEAHEESVSRRNALIEIDKSNGFDPPRPAGKHKMVGKIAKKEA